MSRIRSRHTPVAPGPPEVIDPRPPRPHQQFGLGPFADAYPAADTSNVALENRRRRDDKDDWLWAYSE